MGINYTWEHVQKIREKPHLIGHLVGKDLLTDMHSDWIRYIWDTTESRALQGHRGSYKSTAIIECGVPWYLMWNPSHRIAIVRKTYTAAAEVVRSIANHMEHPLLRPLLEKVWGTKWKFTTRREGKINLSVKTTATPQVSIEALGLDTNIVGKHYDRAVLDDFIDINDRISEAEREKTKLLVQEISSNIVDRTGTTSYIGTPWERRDAWTIVPPAIRYPINKTGLITNLQAAEIKSRTTPILFAANYDLRFDSEADLIFINPRMGTWHFDDVSEVSAHLDAAYKGKDFNALTIMGKLPNGKLNAIGWIYPGTVKDWFPFITQQLLRYGAKKFYCETNSDKGYTADILGRVPELRKEGIWMEDYHESTNKDAKIQSYAYEAWPLIEWSKDTDPAYLEQVCDYRPKNEPDDAPDSLASLVREGCFSSVTDWAKSGIWAW